MSIETLTGDEFANLSPDEHREALDLYNVAMTQQSGLVSTSSFGSPEHEAALDKLSRQGTLRKLHKARLAELEDDEPAPLLASEQYHQNELMPLL